MSFDANALKPLMSGSVVIVAKHNPGYHGVLAGDALRFELGWNRGPALFEQLKVPLYRRDDELHTQNDCRELRTPGSGDSRPGGGYKPITYHPTFSQPIDFAVLERQNNQLAGREGAKRTIGRRRSQPRPSGLCTVCCRSTALLNAIRDAHPVVWQAVAVELAAVLLERGVKATRTRSSTVRAKALNDLTSAETVIEMLDGGTELPLCLFDQVEELKGRLAEVNAAAEEKVAASAEADLADLNAKMRKQMELGDAPVDETPVACAIPASAIRTGGGLFQTARANWRVAGNDRGEILVAPCWAWTWLVGKIGSTHRIPDPALVVVAGRDWLNEPGAWDDVISLWDPTSDGPLASLLGAIDAASVLQREPV